MLATCQLNQWALSFKHNKQNIIQSIVEAKRLGATYRLGPELEVTGYGCEDHFFEVDTVKHSWETIAEILADKDLTKGILCDVGMPIHFNNTLYNCRVLMLDQKILLIRPKICLAGGNNYRERRWFTPWTSSQLVNFPLSEQIRRVTGQKETLFGNGVI